MKTQLIIKADKTVKDAAQEMARELGLPLSTVVNAYLKEFVRTRTVTFSLDQELRPEVGALLKQASEDFRNGKNVSPTLSNKKDMLEYLHAQ